MRILLVLAFVLVGFVPHAAQAGRMSISEVPPGFVAYTVKRGDTWDTLTEHDAEVKLLAQRINRMNVRLQPGMRILVPIHDDAFAYIPVPEAINSFGRHLIIYKKEQYFGAYEDGRLVHWGPVSSGKRGSTPTGHFKAIWKSRWHRSRKYKNARMYFAVQFKGDYFTHEQVLPGYPASHGCVRMLWEDAEWKFSWLQQGDKISVLQSTEMHVADNQ